MAGSDTDGSPESRPTSLSIDDISLSRGPSSDDRDERRSRWSTGSAVVLDTGSVERGPFRGNVTSPFLLHQFVETPSDALLPSLREAAAALCRTADRDTLLRVIELLQEADPRNHQKRQKRLPNGALRASLEAKVSLQPFPNPQTTRATRLEEDGIVKPEKSNIKTDFSLGSSAPSRIFGLPPRMRRTAGELPRDPPSPPHRQISTTAALAPKPQVVNEPRLRTSKSVNQDNTVSRSVEQIRTLAKANELRRSASTPALQEATIHFDTSLDEGFSSSRTKEKKKDDFAYQNRESTSTAMLRELADASSAVKLGLDLGGSLTKLVIAAPLVNGQNHSQAACKAARADDSLKLKVLLADGQATVLHFAKTSTGELEDILKALADPPRLSDDDTMHQDTKTDRYTSGHGQHKRKKKNGTIIEKGKDEKSKAESYMTATIVEGIAEDESDTDSDNASSPESRKGRRRIPADKNSSDDIEGRRIVAAGGGAHKLRGKFRLALGIELTPFREMQSVVDGLLLLHELGVENEVYKVLNLPLGTEKAKNNQENIDDHLIEHPQRTPAEVPAAWPKPLLPLLLVNVGSGVSCLLVTREGYARIGGTAIGGATFLGLARALTPATTFDEAIELAAAGNAAKVDTLVGDIYGNAGCVDLGLPPSLTAASFGKLARSDTDYSPADVCRALLEMVAQSCCVLARAHASQLGCRQRVFFAGGFVDGNPLARTTIANSLRSLGGRAHFLRHSDFLGALGATAMCLSGGPKQKVLQMPSSDRYDHVLEKLKSEMKSEETVLQNAGRYP